MQINSEYTLFMVLCGDKVIKVIKVSRFQENVQRRASNVNEL